MLDGKCRTYLWVRFAIRVCDHGRKWEVGRGGPGGRFHLDLANTKRQGMFVIIENLNLASHAIVVYREPGGSEHLALVKGNARPRMIWVWGRIRRRA